MSLILGAAIAAAFATPLSTDEPTRQPETVVTATRRAQTVDETLTTVNVITRADIERVQAVELIDVLRAVPGVDIARTGGDGSSTSVFVRGANSNHVLVLIDGVRVASSNTGAYAWEHLPVDQIERVEVVRGPRASYYGSDAIGGVIQIFTRRPVGAHVDARVGRYQRVGGTAAYGVAGERGGFGVALGGESSDGFSAQLPSGFSYDPDRDGYINRNLSVNGALTLGAHELSARGLGTRADVEFDQGRTRLANHSIGVGARGPISDTLTYSVLAGTAREDLMTPANFTRFLTRRENVDAFVDWNLVDAQHLVAGVNYQHERGASIDLFSGAPSYRESRDNRAAFVSWQGNRDAFDWEAAARVDDNSAFGGTGTGQLAGGWRYGDAGRVFASIGQGFRAPNLNELYSPGFGGLFAGNPDLDPERSHSVEVGIDHRVGAQRIGVRAFRTKVEDLIAFQGGQTFQAVNVNRVDIDGLELTWGTQWRAWTLDANATWQRAEDVATGELLLRRPRRKYGLSLDRDFDGGAQAGASARYVSRRRDFGGDLGGYTTFEAHATWPLTAGWRLGARLENASDHDYQLVRDFATPGRSLIVTLSWDQSR